MADTKISAMTALTGANTASGDKFPVIDVSEADATKNKSMTREELIAAIIQGLSYQVPLWSDAAQYIGPMGGTIGAGAQTVDRLHMQPIIVPSKRTFTTLGVSTTVVGTNSHIRLGLYNADPVTLHPTTLIFEGDNVLDTGTGTGLKTTPFNAGAGTILFPGLYFLACVSDGTPATINRIAAGSAPSSGWYVTGATISPNVGLYRTYTYAALQADETGNTFLTMASAGSSPPAIFLR